MQPLGPTLFAPVAPAMPEAYAWLVLDIETGNPPSDQVEAWVRDFERPPANYKAEKAIEDWYAGRIEKAQSKAAVCPVAPVFVVSLRSPSELRCLHCLEERPARMVRGGLVEGFASRREMLVALQRLLDARCTPETVLAGHNIEDFDLPRLRLAYARERLQQPAIFYPSRDVATFDTMKKCSRYFAVGDSDYVKLDRALKWFGIPSHKGQVDGSMVPGMIEGGRFDELEEYALLDAYSEAELYLRMTGAVDDAPVREEGAAA